MSYEIKKPITDTQRADFIVQYNHNNGLIIQDGTDTYTQDELTLKGDFLFALEANEMMSDVEAEIDVPDVDEDGNIIYIEIEVEVPIYDEEGNIIGYDKVKKPVPQTHKETTTVHKPVINPNYEEEQEKKERKRLNALNLTKADFWIALLDRDITKAMVKEKINLLPDEKLKAKTLIRIDEADHFWRGDPSMDIIGAMFDITPADLDYLFQNKELPKKDEE